ncbi:MAG: LptF/LptG family permease [Bryobacterales bacterium]
MGAVPAYIYYLLPFLFYETAPLAVMVATLVCFGLLAKHHELTAFRACGISLYRLAAPVLLASMFVSGALFALDHYTLPETNRRQDAIRDEIKDRPARTFLNADRQWTFSMDERIFYHHYFDWGSGRWRRSSSTTSASSLSLEAAHLCQARPLG